MIIDVLLGVFVFTVLPLAGLAWCHFYQEGCRHHSSTTFELWVAWRTWVTQRR